MRNGAGYKRQGTTNHQETDGTAIGLTRLQPVIGIHCFLRMKKRRASHRKKQTLPAV
jgi:hypothetical protein